MQIRNTYTIIITALLILVSCNKTEQSDRVSVISLDSLQVNNDDAYNDFVIGVSKGREDILNIVDSIIGSDGFDDMMQGMLSDAIMRYNGDEAIGTPVKLDPHAVYSNKKLRVVCSADNAPMNWTDSVASEWSVPIVNDRDGHANGVDVELAKIIANVLGCDLTLFKVNRTKLIEAVNSGVADIIISSYNYSPTKEDYISFSKPYYTSVPVLITKRSFMDGTFDEDEIEGKKIIAQRGTPYSEILRDWSQRYDIHNLSTKASTEALVDEVKKGEVDAVLTSYPVGLCATYKANESEGQCIFTIDRSVLSEDFIRESLALNAAFPKGSPYKKKVDDFISSLKQEDLDKMMQNAVSLYKGEAVDPVNAVKLSYEAQRSNVTIKIANECGYPPFNMSKVSEDEWTLPVSGQKDMYVYGFEFEILKSLANYLHVNIEIYKYDFDAIVTAVKTGAVDIAFSTLSVTPERLKSVDFSKPYYISDVCVLTTKNTSLMKHNVLDSVKGMTIVAQKGTAFETLNNDWHKQYGSEVSPSLQRIPDMILALKSGIVDGVILDKPTAESIIANKEKTADMSFYEKTVYLIKNYKKVILQGIIMTLTLTLFATTIGLLLGILLAIGRSMRPNDTDNAFIRGVKKAIKVFCDVYVTVFRGTPLLIQSMVIFFSTPIWSDMPSIYIFGGYFLCALVVMSMNIAAYMCEIIRGGLSSIDKGQTEGAIALGLTPSQTNRYVLLPQAIKNTLPAILNEYIVSLKDSSILNVIGLTELFGAITMATNVNYFKIEGYLLVSVIYLLLTFLLTLIITLITKKLLNEKIDINPFKHAVVKVSEEDKLLLVDNG